MTTTKEEGKLDFNYTGDFPECMSADAGHGITVKIMYEEEQGICDPRDCSNLGHMFIDYSGYNLGDYPGDHDYDPRERTIECKDCNGNGDFPVEPEDDPHASIGETRICQTCKGDGEVPVGMFEWLKQEHGARVVIPLFIYEHSGMTISAGENMGSINPKGRNPFDSDAWDTSMVGFIFDTKGTREECGYEKFTDEEIEESLRSEVETYDLYLRGECFYVRIEDADGEVLEDCGGFLGDDCAREEGEMMAKPYVKDAIKRERNNELAERCWRE
jgi:hypothetical protein